MEAERWRVRRRPSEAAMVQLSRTDQHWHDESPSGGVQRGREGWRRPLLAHGHIQLQGGPGVQFLSKLASLLSQPPLRLTELLGSLSPFCQ